MTVLDTRLRLTRCRSFSPGEPICRSGDPGLSMMAVVVGVVRISLPTVRGKELILADLPAGELFGEIAMLDGKPRSANATALTACDLLVLERRNAIPFLEADPAVCLRLMEILCARIRRSDERMADIAFLIYRASSGKYCQFSRPKPVRRHAYPCHRRNWRKWPVAREKTLIVAFVIGNGKAS